MNAAEIKAIAEKHMKQARTHTGPFPLSFEDACTAAITEALKVERPPFPTIMGRPITREEIIEGLRECHDQVLRLEQEKDPTLRGYPDAITVLDYIEQHGLPPK